MNIQYLYYFVVLCEVKNFNIAAKQLYITPSTLSKALLQLEKNFEHKLVIRSNRFEGLTSAGEILFENSKSILSNIDILKSKVREVSNDIPYGEIKIHSLFYYSVDILPNFLLQIREKYPKIIFYIYDNDKSKEKLILENKVDIAFTTEKTDINNFEYFDGLEFKNVIVSSENKKCTWDSLEYIVPFNNKNTDINKSSDGWDNNYKRKEIMLVETAFEALNMCESGLGAAFLPYEIAKKSISNGKLHIVSEAPFSFSTKTYVIYSDKFKYLFSINTIINELKNYLKDKKF